MKIVFMGTPELAAGVLKALYEAGHEIRAVVTQPDKPKGRGKTLQMSPVKEFALEKGIEVFQPVRIRKPEAVEKLKEYDAQIFVVAAFGQILSQEILDMMVHHQRRRKNGCHYHADGRRDRHGRYAFEKGGSHSPFRHSGEPVKEAGKGRRRGGRGGACAPGEGRTEACPSG